MMFQEISNLSPRLMPMQQLFEGGFQDLNWHTGDRMYRFMAVQRSSRMLKEVKRCRKMLNAGTVYSRFSSLEDRSVCSAHWLFAAEGVLPSGRRLRDASDARDGYGCILSDAGSCWKNRCELRVVVAIDAGSN